MRVERAALFHSDALKRAKMLDILRRLIANPDNAPEVADQLSADWFPVMRVKSDASVEFVIGDGTKR